MKTLNIFLIMVLAMMGVLTPLSGYADEVADAIAEHQKMADSYQNKIADQDALIEEHRQMKEDYKNRFAINPKVGPPAAVEKMNEHCDAIIADAEKLKANLQDFAHWHSMRAAELQGQ